jgi:hypothetical protein
MRSFVKASWYILSLVISASLMAEAQNAPESPTPSLEEAYLNNRRPLSVTLTSGERLFGRVSTVGEGRLMIHSARAGKVGVDWKDVAQISGKDPHLLSGEDMAKVRGRDTRTGVAGGSSSPPAPIGEEDQDEISHLLFLRQSSVLLKPGQFDVELGVQYRRNQKFLYVPAITEEGTLAARDSVRRELETRLAFRAAVANGVEVFASVPMVYTSEEEFRETGEVSDSDDFGIGDTAFGVKAQLIRESERMPEVVLAVTGIAPTGEDLYTGQRNAITLGGGFWAVAAGLTFIKSYDPVILFAGVDYIHRFDRTSSGREISPAQEIAYGFGLGFAVNDSITLSGQLQGGYVGDSEVDGAEIEGSSSEPMSVRLGLTCTLGARRYIDSFVSFGVTEDAPDSVIGASVTQRF